MFETLFRRDATQQWASGQPARRGEACRRFVPPGVRLAPRRRSLGTVECPRNRGHTRTGSQPPASARLVHSRNGRPFTRCRGRFLRTFSSLCAAATSVPSRLTAPPRPGWPPIQAFLQLSLVQIRRKWPRRARLAGQSQQLVDRPRGQPAPPGDFPLRATALVVQSQDFLNHIHRHSRFSHHELLPGKGIRPLWLLAATLLRCPMRWVRRSQYSETTVHNRPESARGLG